MRQQSSIVAASGEADDGLNLTLGKRGGVPDVGLTSKNGTVNQRLNELQNRRLHEIEILNVDLRRVQARPRTRNTATVASVCLPHTIFTLYEQTFARRGSMHFAKITGEADEFGGQRLRWFPW